MRIDYSNKGIIDSKDIYVHDAVFTGFNYDYENNIIEFEAIEYYYKKHFKFKFCNVLGFEMLSCDFWGRSPHINVWYTSDTNDLSTKMKDIQREKKWELRLKDTNKWVESIISFISGDTLTIVCEYIEFEENEYQGE